MTIDVYELPDMSDRYKYNFNVVWQSREYEIILTNNTRSENITMDMSTLDDNGNVIYIIKNAVLSQNINLMALVYSQYWDGLIYILENNNKDTLITSDNLHTNFSIIILTEDEFE